MRILHKSRTRRFKAFSSHDLCCFYVSTDASMMSRGKTNTAVCSKRAAGMDEETRVFLSLVQQKQTQSKYFLESSLNHSASSHHLIETRRQFHIFSFETTFRVTSLDNIEKKNGACAQDSDTFVTSSASHRWLIAPPPASVHPDGSMRVLMHTPVYIL